MLLEANGHSYLPVTDCIVYYCVSCLYALFINFVLHMYSGTSSQLNRYYNNTLQTS